MLQDMLTDADRAELMKDMGILAETGPVTVTVQDPAQDTPAKPVLMMPDGLVPAEWVKEQFDNHKATRESIPNKELRSAHNKKLYKDLQDARSHHNAAVKRRMKEDKLQVVSGEVARRVREANEKLAEPIDLDEGVLGEVATQVLNALLKARG